MNKQEIKHQHTLDKAVSEEIKACSSCGKTTQEMWGDADDIDPTTRLSQQPHGKQTHYCNMCQMYVQATEWDGEKVCPYHQRTMNTEEGPVLMYEEFDQDGEDY